MPPPLRLTHLQASARLSCERSFAIGLSRGPIVPAFTHPSTHYQPLHASKATSSCSFSTTSPHPRKGASKSKELLPSSNSAHIPDNKAQANRDRAIDPYDFSELEIKIKHQVDWLRESLQKLRSGGRLSPDTIEGLSVELKHGLGEKKSVERVRLGDLATVVPKGGRLMAVLVNEEAVCTQSIYDSSLSPSIVSGYYRRFGKCVDFLSL
jgi:ribosome recycling factor